MTLNTELQWTCSSEMSATTTETEMPHYRLDKVGKPCTNGAVPVYATWMFGDSLSAVRNCPIHDTEYRRSVRITGEADTFFSQPAETTLFGVKIKGFITMADESDHDAGYVFHYNKLLKELKWNAS